MYNKINLGDVWVINSVINTLEIVQVFSIYEDKVLTHRYVGGEYDLDTPILLSVSQTEWLNKVDNVDLRSKFGKFIDKMLRLVA